VRFSRLDAHLLRITYLDIFDILEDFFPFTLSFLSCRIHLVFQIDKLQRGVEKLYVTSIYTHLVNKTLPLRPSRRKARTGRKKTCWLPLQYTTNATANIEIETLSMFFSEGVYILMKYSRIIECRVSNLLPSKMRENSASYSHLSFNAKDDNLPAH